MYRPKGLTVTSDGRLVPLRDLNRPRFLELRVADGQVLHAPVGVVDEALELLLAPLPERHLQRVQGEFRV